MVSDELNRLENKVAYRNWHINSCYDLRRIYDHILLSDYLEYMARNDIIIILKQLQVLETLRFEPIFEPLYSYIIRIHIFVCIKDWVPIV